MSEHTRDNRVRSACTLHASTHSLPLLQQLFAADDCLVSSIPPTTSRTSSSHVAPLFLGHIFPTASTSKGMGALFSTIEPVCGNACVCSSLSCANTSLDAINASSR